MIELTVRGRQASAPARLVLRVGGVGGKIARVCHRCVADLKETAASFRHPIDEDLYLPVESTALVAVGRASLTHARRQMSRCFDPHLPNVATASGQG